LIEAWQNSGKAIYTELANLVKGNPIESTFDLEEEDIEFERYLVDYNGSRGTNVGYGYRYHHVQLFEIEVAMKPYMSIFSYS